MASNLIISFWNLLRTQDIIISHCILTVVTAEQHTAFPYKSTLQSHTWVFNNQNGHPPKVQNRKNMSYTFQEQQCFL